MDHTNALTIENICGGCVEERFQRELELVLRNIADVNTPHDQKRTFSLEFEFRPFPDRSGANIVLNVKSKLAAIEPVVGTTFFAKDGARTKAFNHDPRQDNLFGTDKSLGQNKPQ